MGLKKTFPLISTSVSVVWRRVPCHPSPLASSWTSLHTNWRSDWESWLVTARREKHSTFDQKKKCYWSVLVRAHQDWWRFTDEALEVVELNASATCNDADAFVHFLIKVLHKGLTEMLQIYAHCAMNWFNSLMHYKAHGKWHGGWPAEVCVSCWLWRH